MIPPEHTEQNCDLLARKVVEDMTEDEARTRLEDMLSKVYWEHGDAFLIEWALWSKKREKKYE